MTDCLTMTKAGIHLGIIASFPDGTKIESVCDCSECAKKPRTLRYRLLPCGCHGLIVGCTCKVRDKRCQTCGRVFVASPAYEARGKKWVDVYEVEDPHGENAKL